MTALKRILALSLVLALFLCVPFQVSAQSDSSQELIRSIINYFQYHQADARTDYDLLLEQLDAEDPALAEIWSGIVDFWIHLNYGMDVRQNILPDGLPEDDSLCIAVMGYYLKPDGSMRDELYERLRVTLASAEKYPNAYILCTGGGTASENRKVTEASQMAKYLIGKGIPKERIIVENQAHSTIENAQYGCAMLYRDYPQVKTLAVITSDYHIYRSCLYFNTQAALDAYELEAEPIRVLAAATCRINPKAPSDIDTQVEGMSILTGLDVSKLEKPELTKLERICISGVAECPVGSEPELLVSAVYSSGYSRDVTQNATFTGIDFGKAGVQTVVASYEEGDIQKTASMDITFIAPETQLPDLETAPAPDPDPPVSAEQEATSDSSELTLLLTAAGVCAVLLLVLLFLRNRREKKRRHRKKPTIQLD